MNTLEIKDHWNVAKGTAIRNWATLTHDDLVYIKGEHNEWLGRIEKRIGETRESIESAIKGVFSARA